MRSNTLIMAEPVGTSFDVSLIAAGEPALSAEKDIAYGVPLRVPLVDIHTIGAGGGSIARITRAGLLQVGPESAGAHPGPIAYGRGGSAVTFVFTADSDIQMNAVSFVDWNGGYTVLAGWYPFDDAATRPHSRDGSRAPRHHAPPASAPARNRRGRPRRQLQSG
jgi:Hydantoinase/oxoprolinase